MYFSKTLKGVLRDTWDGFVDNRKNTTFNHTNYKL